MLSAGLPRDAVARLRILPAPDNLYQPEAWAAAMKALVDAEMHGSGDAAPTARLGLLGTALDDREAARQLFPQWEWIDVEPFDDCATAAIRHAVLSGAGSAGADLGQCLPPATLARLRATLAAPEFAETFAEFEANEQFRATWASAPWPPVFVTVDAVVVAHDHVLLVQRGRRPGKGLWALPGGFLDPNETLVEACIRELREETNIDVESSALAQSICATRIFDDPQRSLRGRTITHAYLMELDIVPALPSVAGGDDAACARWVPFDCVQRRELFEDHYGILQAMLGIK